MFRMADAPWGLDGQAALLLHSDDSIERSFADDSPDAIDDLQDHLNALLAEFQSTAPDSQDDSRSAAAGMRTSMPPAATSTCKIPAALAHGAARTSPQPKHFAASGAIFKKRPPPAAAAAAPPKAPAPDTTPFYPPPPPAAAPLQSEFAAAPHIDTLQARSAAATTAAARSAALNDALVSAVATLMQQAKAAEEERDAHTVALRALQGESELMRGNLGEVRRGLRAATEQAARMLLLNRSAQV